MCNHDKYKCKYCGYVGCHWSGCSNKRTKGTGACKQCGKHASNGGRI